MTGPHLPDGSASSLLRKSNTNSPLDRLSHNHRLGLAVSQAQNGCAGGGLPKIGKRFQTLEEPGSASLASVKAAPEGKGWAGQRSAAPALVAFRGPLLPEQLATRDRRGDPGHAARFAAPLGSGNPARLIHRYSGFAR